MRKNIPYVTHGKAKQHVSGQLPREIINVLKDEGADNMLQCYQCAMSYSETLDLFYAGEKIWSR